MCKIPLYQGLVPKKYDVARVKMHKITSGFAVQYE